MDHCEGLTPDEEALDIYGIKSPERLKREEEAARAQQWLDYYFREKVLFPGAEVSTTRTMRYGGMNFVERVSQDGRHLEHKMVENFRRLLEEERRSIGESAYQQKTKELDDRERNITADEIGFREAMDEAGLSARDERYWVALNTKAKTEGLLTDEEYNFLMTNLDKMEKLITILNSRAVKN